MDEIKKQRLAELKVFSLGELTGFVSDFQGWYDVSNYLLLVFDNLEDFIYIDDDKIAVKSKQSAENGG